MSLCVMLRPASKTVPGVGTTMLCSLWKLLMSSEILAVLVWKIHCKSIRLKSPFWRYASKQTRTIRLFNCSRHSGTFRGWACSSSGVQTVRITGACWRKRVATSSGKTGMHVGG